MKKTKRAIRDLDEILATFNKVVSLIDEVMFKRLCGREPETKTLAPVLLKLCRDLEYRRKESTEDIEMFLKGVFPLDMLINPSLGAMKLAADDYERLLQDLQAPRLMSMSEWAELGRKRHEAHKLISQLHSVRCLLTEGRGKDALCCRQS